MVRRGGWGGCRQGPVWSGRGRGLDQHDRAGFLSCTLVKAGESTLVWATTSPPPPSKGGAPPTIVPTDMGPRRRHPALNSLIEAGKGARCALGCGRLSFLARTHVASGRS
eukprot:scaffold3426_cov355-Prasinococcus_capsulatus_cf.AAC.8